MGGGGIFPKEESVHSTPSRVYHKRELTSRSDCSRLQKASVSRLIAGRHPFYPSRMPLRTPQRDTFPPSISLQNWIEGVVSRIPLGLRRVLLGEFLIAPSKEVWKQSFMEFGCSQKGIYLLPGKAKYPGLMGSMISHENASKH